MSTKADQIVREARRLTGDRRVRYLDVRCGADSDLRAKVDAALRSGSDTDGSPAPSADPVAPSTPIELSPAAPPQDEVPPGASSAPASEAAGAQIGRYKLLEVIGEGGFGTVWMAEQREPVRRRVALKLIKLGMDTKQVIARFDAERQALAMMEHPNIARVLDAGSTESGRPYFVMEYIRGVPVLQYCDGARLDTRSRLSLFASVCHAIQHAHQKGVIHRDIKPSNVLVTLHDGVPVPKVIDFGIAKATSGELTQRTLFTEHRQMLGTPAYMSPEQAEMSGLDVDTRSDVYSLGVLLYELLTGTTPFDMKEVLAKGYSELMRVIREVEPHRPSTRVSRLTDSASVTAHQRHVEDTRKLGVLLRGDLDWIVMKCLEKDRSRRYDTAADLAADVRRHLAGEAVVAAPPSAAYRFRKFVLRHKGEVTAAALVLFALVAGVVGTTSGLVKASAARVLAEDARHEADRLRSVADEQRGLAVQGEQRALEEKENARRALARAQIALAEAAYREHDGRSMIARLDEVPADLRDSDWKYLLEHADSSRATVPEFHCGAAAHPLRPGVFAATTNRSIQVFDAATGAVELEFPVSARQQRNPYRRALAFSPDGERLAAGSLGDGGVTVYDAKSGRPLVEWDAPESDTLEFSADGRRLLGAGSIEGKVFLWDAGTGAEVWQIASAFGALFDPAGGQVLVHRRDGARMRIDRVDAADGAVRATLFETNAFAPGLAVRPDGKVIATADLAGRLAFHDAATGRLILENRLQHQSIWSIGFTGDGRRLVSVGRHSDRQALNVWGAETGVLLQSLLGGAGKPEGLVVHPLTGDVLVTGPVTKAWNIAQPAPVAVLRSFSSASFLGADDRCVCGTRSGKAASFDLAASPPAAVWESTAEEFELVEASQDGRVVALGHSIGDHSEVVIVHADGPRLVESARLQVSCMMSFMRLSPDGRRLLTFIPAGGTCHLIDTVTGRPVNRPDDDRFDARRLDDCDVRNINDLAWLSATRVVGVSTVRAFRGDPRSGESLVLWDVDAHRQVATVANAGVITCVAAVPGAPAFAEAGVDKTIRIRDSETLEVRKSFRAHDEAVTALAWHPSLPLLASASEDLTVKLWDVESGRCVREIRGVLKPPTQLRFGPGGTRLLAVSGGGVWVWDVGDLRGPQGPR